LNDDGSDRSDFDIGASIMVKLPRIETAGQSVGVSGPSVPIPKFAYPGASSDANFGFGALVEFAPTAVYGSLLGKADR
jgi:hypothetical protein